MKKALFIFGILFLLSPVALFCFAERAQAQEFVIFTKGQDMRFPSDCTAAKAGPCERYNPTQPPCPTSFIFSCRGFDPTKNISSGLSTPINCPDQVTNCPTPPDGALELFIRLGPGEATGNMHGRIQGVDGTLCKELSSSGSNFCAGVGNLNLGIEKYNPQTQQDSAPCVGLLNAGSSIGTANPAENCIYPTGNGVNTAGDGTHGFSEGFGRNDDFFPGAIEHAAFTFNVNFKWMDVDAADPSNLCNANRSGMPPFAGRCTYTTQTVEQVTALDPQLGIGTRTAPGPGDQFAQMKILGWASQNNNDLYTTPGDAAAQAVGVNPRIAWKQWIKDPNFSGLSGYEDEMNGAFTYCHGAHNVPGDPCFSVVLPDAVYPTGTSQTIGNFKSCLHYDPSTGTTGAACP